MFSKMRTAQLQESYRYYKMEEIPMTKDLSIITEERLGEWFTCEYLPKLKAHNDRMSMLFTYMSWCEGNVNRANSPRQLEDAERILAEWRNFERLHSDKMQQFISHACKYFRSNYTRNDEDKFCKITWGEKHEVILIPV